jgi:hypothetical protein
VRQALDDEESLVVPPSNEEEKKDEKGAEEGENNDQVVVRSRQSDGDRRKSDGDETESSTREGWQRRMLRSSGCEQKWSGSNDKGLRVMTRPWKRSTKSSRCRMNTNSLLCRENKSPQHRKQKSANTKRRGRAR